MPLFSLKMHTSNVFSKARLYNYLNVLIDLWPNPSLVKGLSVKPGLNVVAKPNRVIMLV